MTEQELAEKVEHTLKASETMTDNPPYICLPTGGSEWIQLKTLRILALIKEAGGWSQPEPPADRVEAVASLITPYLASPYRHAEIVAREILKLIENKKEEVN